MPIASYQNATVRIRAAYEDNSAGSYSVRNRDDEGWIAVGTGNSITVTYDDTMDANLWAWDNRPTASTTGTGPYTQWVWNNMTTTSATTRYTVDAWNQSFDQMRVTRAQSDLQRAIEAARVAGNAQREWSIAEWAESADVDLEDFTDEQSGQVMETYLHSYAIAVNHRFDVDAEARREREAERRAEHLLTSLLSAEQKRDWLENRGVTEVAPSGRIWRVIPQWSGGALLMDPENPTVRRVTLCVHPQTLMPVVDCMVSVLLAVRNGDEAMLLGLANVHSGSLTAEERQIKSDWRAGRRTQAAPAVVAEAAAAVEVA